jgi:hypothetical protein
MTHLEYTTRVVGWPSDSGPLPTLHKIGLLPDVNSRPVWVSHPKTLTDVTGAITYKGFARFMNAQGLRALAALTLEGWAVTVNANGENLDFTIRRAR